jgi:hypothetical protein
LEKSYQLQGVKIMAENTGMQTERQAPQPNPDLRQLDRLVGTWDLSGPVQGTTKFKWRKGGFFLAQRYKFDMDGQPNKGMEIIGHERSMTGEESPEIKSRIYGYLDGLVQDYTYEFNKGDAGFTIWMPEKGAPAFCDVSFSDDDNTITLTWTFPGGGYTVTARRRGQRNDIEDK